MFGAKLWPEYTLIVARVYTYMLVRVCAGLEENMVYSAGSIGVLSANMYVGT